MTDVLFLVTLVAFFALMIAFVRLCERIVGRDNAVDAATDDAPDGVDRAIDATPEEVPA